MAFRLNAAEVGIAFDFHSTMALMRQREDRERINLAGREEKMESLRPTVTTCGGLPCCWEVLLYRSQNENARYRRTRRILFRDILR